MSVWGPGLLTLVLLRGGDVGRAGNGTRGVRSALWKVLPEYPAHSEALPPRTHGFIRFIFSSSIIYNNRHLQTTHGPLRGEWINDA